MDKAKSDEIRVWLDKSWHDLRAAERLLIGSDPLCDAAGFHCQQAAEKSLKAYLTWHDVPFEKTHSLVALVAQCLMLDPSFEELRSATTTLTPYAVASRYPGDIVALTEAEAQAALKLARQVWDFVRQRLASETQSEQNSLE